MTFKICKVIDGRPMWLKKHAPTVTWVARTQARGFKTKGDAIRVLKGLPTTQLVTVVEDTLST
jgi:hypothetical protein